MCAAPLPPRCVGRASALALPRLLSRLSKLPRRVQSLSTAAPPPLRRATPAGPGRLAPLRTCPARARLIRFDLCGAASPTVCGGNGVRPGPAPASPLAPLPHCVSSSGAGAGATTKCRMPPGSAHSASTLKWLPGSSASGAGSMKAAWRNAAPHSSPGSGTGAPPRGGASPRPQCVCGCHVGMLTPGASSSSNLPRSRALSNQIKSAGEHRRAGSGVQCRVPPPLPPPSRTNWTRLVPPSVLIGQVLRTACFPRHAAGCARRGRTRTRARAPCRGAAP